jgi:uncharacterized membrane protein YdjX (TVP38/TMEM64 family)
MLKAPIVKLVVAVAALAGFVLLGRSAAAYVPAFAERVESLGALGPVVFVAGYIVATVAMVPGSILTLAGGALFGIVQGTLLVFIAASIGATLAFLISRYAARDALVRRYGSEARFRAIDAAIARDGRRIVFLLRLSPAFPFNVMNYALGLTGVRLRDYVVACIGMLPGTMLWVYYGRVIGDVAQIIAGRDVPRGAGYWLVLGAGLVATLAVTIVITRAARRALDASLEEPSK